MCHQPALYTHFTKQRKKRLVAYERRKIDEPRELGQSERVSYRSVLLEAGLLKIGGSVQKRVTHPERTTCAVMVTTVKRYFELVAALLALGEVDACGAVSHAPKHNG